MSGINQNDLEESSEVEGELVRELVNEVSFDEEDSGNERTSNEESEYDDDDDDEDSMEIPLPKRPEEIGELPKTVTTLTTPEGSTVYLVGTAHFSLESQDDVGKTINQTQPNVVVVELCKGRLNILNLDEETIIREAKDISLDKMRAVIKQNGVMHGIMYLFLLKMSAHITEQLGMAPGGEFRRAFAEAKKVPGCMIHLGDRPIQITIHRALSQLNWWQKLCLISTVLRVSKEPITKEEVEKCKNKDLIDELLAEMSGKYPEFSRVFVQERDMFLAHALRLAATPIPCKRSEAGVVPAVVVGVVGMGHIPGIVARWNDSQDVNIPELMRIPPPSLAGKVVKTSLKASVWLLVAWGIYKIANRPSLLGFLSRSSSSK